MADIGRNLSASRGIQEEDLVYRKSVFLLLVVALVGVLVAGCAVQTPAAPQIVKETVVVEKQVEKIVEKVSTQVVEKQVEKVVTPTPAPRGAVKVTLWYHLAGDYPGMIPFWQEKSKEWLKTHPNVTLDFVSIPYDGSDAKYTSTFAGQKNAPDIFFGKVPYFAGGLGVADPAPKDIAALWDQEAADPIKEYLKYGGQYYGFPIETDLGMMLYYNTDMFTAAGLDPAKPPTTMDEMLAYAQKLAKVDASGQVTVAGFGVRYDGNAKGIADKWLPFLHSFGGQLYAPDESTSDKFINSPEAIASLQFYGDLVNKYKVSSLKMGKPEDAFCQKRAAMFFREAYMVGQIRDNCPDVKYAVASLPSQKTRAGYSILFQDSLMVYKFSPNKDLAWDWLKFMTTNEQFSLEQAKTLGTLPTHKALFVKDPYITQRPDFKAETATIANPPGPYYGHPYINEISFRVGQAVSEVLFGLKDAKKALTDAVPDVNDTLKKRP
jgi:multiple sugar transport system substrate-binding protein